MVSVHKKVHFMIIHCLVRSFLQEYWLHWASPLPELFRWCQLYFHALLGTKNYHGIVGSCRYFSCLQVAGKRYGQKVALVSAALFAVMPISWIFRRIFAWFHFVALSLAVNMDSTLFQRFQTWRLASFVIWHMPGPCSVYKDTCLYHDSFGWRYCLFWQHQALQVTCIVVATSDFDSTIVACPKHRGRTF